MGNNCCLHVFDYSNNYVNSSTERAKWQRYLRSYLFVDESVRILYSAFKNCYLPPVMADPKCRNCCDYTFYDIDSNFREKRSDLVIDYDVIIRHSDPTVDANGEVEKNKELACIKEFALSISEEHGKRVSFGFVYDTSKFKIHIFYSVLPDGSFTSEEVDMSDSCGRDSDFSGKVLYMHNCLVQKDKENGSSKKIRFPRPGYHA